MVKKKSPSINKYDLKYYIYLKNKKGSGYCNESNETNKMKCPFILDVIQSFGAEDKRRKCFSGVSFSLLFLWSRCSYSGTSF